MQNFIGINDHHIKGLDMNLKIKKSTSIMVERILDWNSGNKKSKYYFFKIEEFKKINKNKSEITENILAAILRNDIFLFFIIENEFDIKEFLKSCYLKEEGKSVASRLFCNSKDFYIGIRLCSLFKFSDSEIKNIAKKAIKNLIAQNIIDKKSAPSLDLLHKISRLAEQFKISEEEISSFFKLIYLNKRFLKNQ